MIILQDTREKQPWKFVMYEQCSGQKIKYLLAGDYVLEGYPDLICIERKKTVTELANNLGAKYSQFKDEMERLQHYRFRYVICEFTQEKMLIYPTGSKLPRWLLKKIKMSGKFLQHQINELIDRYGIEFVFCENKFEATNRAMELLLKAKEIYDQEHRA